MPPGYQQPGFNPQFLMQQHAYRQMYMMQPQMMGGKGGMPGPGMGPGMGPGAMGGKLGPQMPPTSSYVAPQKQENPEFNALQPGEARTMKGYNSEIPISEKGATMMATYERVMARPQGSFPNAYSSSRGQPGQPGLPGLGGGGGGGGGGKSNECHFHNTSQGCRNGTGCAFLHSDGSSSKFGKSKVKCRNLPNCTFGPKCRFLH
eukprot:TRINITY_DN8617_c0_g3_i1.p2 TRINITY_DN8617_c0_g3~~TRINITY_DN8617_c0_g3_i1.p2  ORF type:complete len:222 (+),score=32.59 TRINITY_DN8617_c0_g3_i1:57-668(+)